jgi:putative membrane protein
MPLTLGLITLLVVWFAPLHAALPAFTAHMARHIGVVAVGAPLIAFALAGSRFDPVRVLPAHAAVVPASIVELIVVWSWHAPALHAFARHTTIGLVIEQAAFFASALVVWLLAFGGVGHQARAAGILALLLTSMHMTLLGALIALAPRPLFGDHGAAPSSLTPLEDQHLGGALMLLVGGSSYLLGALYLAARLLDLRHEGVVSTKADT